MLNLFKKKPVTIDNDYLKWCGEVDKIERELDNKMDEYVDYIQRIWGEGSWNRLKQFCDCSEHYLFSWHEVYYNHLEELYDLLMETYDYDDVPDCYGILLGDIREITIEAHTDGCQQII